MCPPGRAPGGNTRHSRVHCVLSFFCSLLVLGQKLKIRIRTILYGFKCLRQNISWYKHFAQRPCKSKPKILMKEFPVPKCTKVSYLYSSDVVLCDSWNVMERNTGILQRLWYQQVGVWEIFRQTYSKF